MSDQAMPSVSDNWYAPSDWLHLRAVAPGAGENEGSFVILCDHV